MRHAMNYTHEIRDLPPVGGWRTVECGDEARATCACGLDTGVLSPADALSQAIAHGAETGAQWAVTQILIPRS